MHLVKALVCEFLGTALLLATVVGSGILAHNLDDGVIAITVLSVAFATGAVLYGLVLTLGPISCHINPVVTLANAVRREFPWQLVVPYILMQFAGATFGVMLANLMFDLPVVSIGETVRSGPGQWLSEFIATFCLLGVIFGSSRFRPESTPQAVALYVAGAILFTASTCFANPAVSFARLFTDTITGIRAIDVPPFILAELIGGAAGCLFFSWLFAAPQSSFSHINSRVASEEEREMAGARR